MSTEHALPYGSVIDEDLLRQVAHYPQQMTLWQLRQLLSTVETDRRFDAARLLAQELVIPNLSSMKREKLYSIRDLADT